MEQIIERKQFVSLVNHLKEKEASIIIGLRQVGKTTFFELAKRISGKLFKN